MTETYHNYINGDWVKSASDEWFDNVNPADTTDIVGRFPKSNAEDVNNAVEAAKNTATRWRRTPAPKRAEILFKLAQILERNKDEFTRQMTREMGKVLKEAGGDVQEAIDCTYYTAGEGRRLHGFTTPAEMPNKFAMCVRQPVGISFQLGIAIGKLNGVISPQIPTGWRTHIANLFGISAGVVKP